MRVPSWLPTSALVGMLIYVLVYLGLFLAFMVTRNDTWLVLMYVSMIVYLIFTGFHISRRRKRRRT